MAKLQTGDKMPNFTFDTAFHQGLTVDEVVKKQPKTIFWVLRYIGCTTCRYDVHILSQRYQEFLDKGAQIYVVMQSDPAVVRHDLEGYPIPFEIICDTDMKIYETLEIGSMTDQAPAPETMEKVMAKVQAAKALGFEHGKYEGNEKQLPAMFMTDSDGKVLYAHYAADGMDMPTPDDMLALL